MALPELTPADSVRLAVAASRSITEDECAGANSNDFAAAFDVVVYAQAKPHFEEALTAFQAADKSLNDLFKLLIEEFGERIKPYAVQFAKDKKLTLNLEQQDALERCPNAEGLLKASQDEVLGREITFMASSGRVTFTVDTPDPPSGLSEDEFEGLMAQLRGCMPIYGIISDLGNWDIQLYDGMGDDWYFLAVFGDASTIEECAEQLAEFFHAKCDKYGMDYNQQADPDWFEAHVLEQAEEFVTGWRRHVVKRCCEQVSPP